MIDEENDATETSEDRPPNIILPPRPGSNIRINVNRNDPDHIRAVRAALKYMLRENGFKFNKEQNKIFRDISDYYFFGTGDRKYLKNILDQLEVLEGAASRFLKAEASLSANLLQLVEGYEQPEVPADGALPPASLLDRMSALRTKCNRMIEAYKPGPGAPENLSITYIVARAVRIYEIETKTPFPKSIVLELENGEQTFTNLGAEFVRRLIQTIDYTITAPQIRTALRKLPPSRPRKRSLIGP